MIYLNLHLSDPRKRMDYDTMRIVFEKSYRVSKNKVLFVELQKFRMVNVGASFHAHQNVADHFELVITVSFMGYFLCMELRDVREWNPDEEPF